MIFEYSLIIFCEALMWQLLYLRLPSSVWTSALYVVDLKKFRKIAAGDRLRGQYQALSQDPNSLSNLDQVTQTHVLYWSWMHSTALQTDYCGGI